MKPFTDVASFDTDIGSGRIFHSPNQLAKLVYKHGEQAIRHHRTRCVGRMVNMRYDMELKVLNAMLRLWEAAKAE